MPANGGDPAHTTPARDPRARRRGLRRERAAGRLEEPRRAFAAVRLGVDRPLRARRAGRAWAADAPAPLRRADPDRARLPVVRGRPARAARAAPGALRARPV